MNFDELAKKTFKVFEVGDRVRIKVEYGFGKNKTGTITSVSNDTPCYFYVKFDEPSEDHSFAKGLHYYPFALEHI